MLEMLIIILGSFLGVVIGVEIVLLGLSIMER